MAESSEIKEIGRITKHKSSATIDWKIHKYFAVSHKRGKEFNSPFFNFRDVDWYLSLVQNVEKDSVDWIGLYLYGEGSKTEKHDIKFTLGVRNGDGSIYKSWSTKYQFQENSNYCGTAKLVQKTSIWENAHKIAPDKHLAIFCVLNANDPELDPPSSESEDEDVSEGLRDTGNPSSSEDQIHTQKESLPDAANVFFKDMEDLLVSKRLCDVKILVKGKELQAHKAILAARSSVFSAMFEQEMTEKKSNIVEILDWEFDIFKEFLHYLYTGKVQEVSEINVCEVYVLADKYDVKQLKRDCIAIMNRAISTDNFCDIISFAVKFNESDLLKKATDYFLKNAKNILLTVNWQSFLAETPTVANELFLKLVTERL